MIEIIQSKTFEKWLLGLKDNEARERILARLLRMAGGNMGDVEPVGGGISEARIHYGPGYRIYFMQRGRVMIVVLAAGDKQTQKADIKRAQNMAKEWK